VPPDGAADWWGDGAGWGSGNGDAPPPRPGTPPMAVWSLVSAIAGFLFCGVVLGPLAVVLGILARQRVRAEGTTGDGIAIAGIVVGVAAFIVNVVVIAVLLSNPDLMDTTTS